MKELRSYYVHHMNHSPNYQFHVLLFLLTLDSDSSPHIFSYYFIKTLYRTVLGLKEDSLSKAKKKRNDVLSKVCVYKQITHVISSMYKKSTPTHLVGSLSLMKEFLFLDHELLLRSNSMIS